MIVMTTTMTTMTMKTTRTMTTTTATASLMQNLHRFGVRKKAQETPRNTYRHVSWGGSVGGISEPTQNLAPKGARVHWDRAWGPGSRWGRGFFLLKLYLRRPCSAPWQRVEEPRKQDKHNMWHTAAGVDILSRRVACLGAALGTLQHALLNAKYDRAIACGTRRSPIAIWLIRVCARACVSVCASSDRLNSVHYQHQLSIALSATCGWIALGAKCQIKCRVAMIMLPHKSRGPPVHNNAAARRGSACS